MEMREKEDPIDGQANILLQMSQYSMLYVGSHPIPAPSAECPIFTERATEESISFAIIM